MARFGLIRLSRDDPGALGWQQAFDAVQGLLQQGTFAAQRKELFGTLLPATRPKPRAAAACQDRRMKHVLALRRRLTTESQRHREEVERKKRATNFYSSLVFSSLCLCDSVVNFFRQNTSLR